MSFRQNLEMHIKAGYPIIYIQTFEEQRLVNEITHIAAAMDPQRNVEIWDYIGGYNRDSSAKKDPFKALEIIYENEWKGSAIFVLKDFHKVIETGGIIRYLRNLAASLKRQKKTIIIISPVLSIPIELEDDIITIDFELPGLDEIRKHINTFLRNKGLISADIEALARACQGLTMNRINLLLKKVLEEKGCIGNEDVLHVINEKKQIIEKSGILEFIPVSETLEDIGGLDNLKAWIRMRGLAFTQKAAKYGLPYPKGVMLTGIQGTGKSLTAKAIARQWNMPMLKLDTGKLMGKYVGESEERTRDMIRLAEAMAPCVIWIDEIDKAFGGVTEARGDSGTSRRVFGTLITWMQEKEKPIFIVATANNLSVLPVELLRKGRFDEIFFVHLPDAEERRQIFEIHLKKKRGKLFKKYNTAAFAEATEGYSGAEIEQIVIEAMFLAYSQSREFTNEDIIFCAKNMIPLSLTATEDIARLEKLLVSGRVRKA